MWGELEAGWIPVCWLTLLLPTARLHFGEAFLLCLFSRLACVNPTLDFMAWPQRSRTVRPLLARELSLCDYKPSLIQALFFCDVAGERLMGWKKTLAQRYGSRSPRCLCLLELGVLRLLSPLLALTFVAGPVATVCTFWHISQTLNQWCPVSFCRKPTGVWPWIWESNQRKFRKVFSLEKPLKNVENRWNDKVMDRIRKISKVFDGKTSFCGSVLNADHRLSYCTSH